MTAITPLGSDANTAPVTGSRSSVQRALLVCGIVAALLYAAMITLIRYEGYSRLAQTPSELAAIGAPTRALWAWLGWVYLALMIGFGWGVWKAAGANRPLRVVAGLILATCAVGFLWPLAPMHQREVLAAGGATPGGTLHVVLAAASVLLFLATIAFGAAAFGPRFRLYSVGTLAVVLVAGALTFAQAPGVTRDLPTPLIGLWERISIGAHMLWLVALAATLLRQGVKHEPGGSRS